MSYPLFLPKTEDIVVANTLPNCFENKIIFGDAREVLKKVPDNFVQTVVTSPPYYGQRDYNADGQVGIEETPEEYVRHLVNIFDQVKRVLKDDGIYLAVSYSGP